ncbi:hypothetical protein M8Z33_14595 [Streptomyces sp. ZAF1911]|uniref:hypothetical protein n=1 Tax=Streptomyces sp. ZAF1911 TaxID=2944129 RepID=UPI00237BEE88|nr:hypothetical protein [Streptomyces sp. ZAF1911]MDD9377867.1 hypothetical protein [Streptomyces sp. ZAF1911]
MSETTGANVWVTEDTGHRFLGQDVEQPASGRRGTVGAVLIYVSRLTGRPVRKVAHMRPLDHSGREWTADPDTLQLRQPIAHSAQASRTQV